MYLEVYLDLFFIFNSIMNFILLFILQFLLRLHTKKIRILGSSLVGACLNCIIIIIPFKIPIISFFFSYVIINGIIVFLLFGFQTITILLKQMLVLYLLTFFFGGVLNACYMVKTSSILILLISIVTAILLYIGMRITFINQTWNDSVYKVKVMKNKKEIVGTGFLDTGNSLQEPFSQKPVIIMEYDFIRTLLTKELNEIIKEFYSNETLQITPLSQLEYIRMIPYHSIGKEHGILFAVCCDQLTIFPNDSKGKKLKEKKKIQNVIIAVYNGQLSNNQQYQIILHKELFI